MLEDDHVAVAHSVLLQRLLVVHEGHAVEGDGDFRGGEARLDLAEGLEVLQLQVFGDVQHEDVVGEGRDGYLHFRDGHGNLAQIEGIANEQWLFGLA